MCPGCCAVDAMLIHHARPVGLSHPRVVHGGYVMAGGTPTWLCAECGPQRGGVHWERPELDPIEDTA